MKVALFHDYFAPPGQSGGGEKLALLLAQAYDADIYTGFAAKEFEGLEAFRVTEISTPSSPGLRTFRTMRAFERLMLPHYDLYLFSGTAFIMAAARHKPNLLYMHTPPRYLYDLRQWDDTHSTFSRQIALRILRHYVYPRDQAAVRTFDKIVTNSETVRKRILRYYGAEIYRKSSAVYSFVDLPKYRHRPPQDYYVSNARLDPLKRVDLVVKAFCQMPDKKLIVLSTGPAEKQIRTLAHGHDNIEFTGWVDERRMIDIMSRCIATIQMPVSEDLGLGAIESMACGKPCIGAREGGLTETIIHRKTGILTSPTIEEITRAVRYVTPARSRGMRQACRSQAAHFSQRAFLQRFHRATNDVVAAYKRAQHLNK